MLYTCKPELLELLGINASTPFRVCEQMHARSDLQPRYVGFDGVVKPNVIKLDSQEDRLHAIKNLSKVGYVMLHPSDDRLEPAELRDPLLAGVRSFKIHSQVVMSYHQGLQTSANRALTALKELTGVEFTLHMTHLNPMYVELWHVDYTGETTTAVSEAERQRVVASLSLNLPFIGWEKTYIEVKDGWSNTHRRDRLVFLNPRDGLHRVVTEEGTQRTTMLFRTTEFTVEQFRDVLQSSNLLEGEAR